jgi:hypothetical protein
MSGGANAAPGVLTMVQGTPHARLFVTTTLIVVVITTTLCGGLTAPLLKYFQLDGDGRYIVCVAFLCSRDGFSWMEMVR